MISPDNPDLRQAIISYLEQYKELFTWVETHGLLCAMAVGPLPPDNWQSQICLDGSIPLPGDISRQLSQLAERMISNIGSGAGITLPCRLDPYEERDGKDLTAWSTGFLSGVLLQESSWYEGAEDTMAELLLPIMLFAGVAEDEDTDTLWQNSKLVRQMAHGIPALLEELFLHFNAPDLPA